MVCFYKLRSLYWYTQYEKDRNTFTITVLLPLPHLTAKGKRQQVLIQMKPELGKTSHNGYIEYFCKGKKKKKKIIVLGSRQHSDSRSPTPAAQCATKKFQAAFYISDASTQRAGRDVRGSASCMAVCRPQPHGRFVYADDSQLGGE